MLLPVLAMHNTVRMYFDIEEAEYLHLTKTDAAFPAEQFSMLADTARNEVTSLMPLGSMLHGIVSYAVEGCMCAASMALKALLQACFQQLDVALCVCRLNQESSRLAGSKIRSPSRKLELLCTRDFGLLA